MEACGPKPSGVAALTLFRGSGRQEEGLERGTHALTMSFSSLKSIQTSAPSFLHSSRFSSPESMAMTRKPM
jgi:hypothetical protein